MSETPDIWGQPRSESRKLTHVCLLLPWITTQAAYLLATGTYIKDTMSLEEETVVVVTTKLPEVPKGTTQLPPHLLMPST